MSRTSPPLTQLYAGADAGHHTLPEELLGLRAAFVTLAADPEPVESTTTVYGRLAEDYVTAALAGRPLPDPAEVDRVRHAEQVQLDHLAVVRLALSELESRIRGYAFDYGDRIVVEHLRPALTKTVDENATTVATLDEYGTDNPANLITAPEKVRRAYARQRDLVDRYKVIRAARFALSNVGYKAEADVAGEFSEIYNPMELRHAAKLGVRHQPWPTDNVRDFLTWMCRNGGQLWLPTVEEQDQRYDRTRGPALRQAQANRQQLTASRHAFG